MGKRKSRRSSQKIAAVIRKKAKAKRQHQRKEAKTKQYPKRSKKMLKAPQALPRRAEIEAFVHESSAFLNEVIRPIESTRAADRGGGYEARLKDLRREILAKHREKVQRARQSYDVLLSSVEEADLVLEVLDARDPTACRLLEAEGSCLGKRPLILVLNKIDLVPQDAVVRWIAFLRETAPTVAVSARSRSAQLALREIVEHVAPSSSKAAIIGIKGVGKSTICAMNPGGFKEIPSYEFVSATPEMGLLKGAEFLDPPYDLAIETLGRVQDDDLYIVLEMPEQESPEDIMAVLGKRWQIKPRLAGQTFMNNLWDGTWRWFAVPPDDIATEFSDAQTAALEASVPSEMSAITYIPLTAGEALTIDEHTLGGAHDDGDGDHEDEEEEEEEEAGE